MFQTVRHWWASGRGKITARLFVFELFVVVAGVMIAQGLANWVASENSDEEMAEARARFIHEPIGESGGGGILAGCHPLP